MLHTAMESVACSLTDMIGQVIVNDAPKIKKVPVDQVSVCTNDSETTVVGIYLQMKSGLYGRVVLIMPLHFALNLVDLMTGTPGGTANKLDTVGISALAEMGNLTLSYFLNAVADSKSEMLHPSPPIVVVDMLSAILNTIVKPSAASDDLLVIETIFASTAMNVEFCFLVLPDFEGIQVNGKTLSRHRTSNNTNSKARRTRPAHKSTHSGGSYA
jgi:chemotaxis protein CheC